MRFHRKDNLLFCSDREGDRDYVRTVSELVLSRYHGEGHHWRPAASDELWHVFFGGRAGIVGVRHNERICCVKLFYAERIRTKLRTALGFAKGRRAYRNGLRLRQAGISCPQILGYAERRPFGPALVLSELIEDGVRLDHQACKHGVERENTIALAHYIRSMHDHGVFHLDLSPRNILIRSNSQGVVFFLLDYEDARFARDIPRRIRLKNIHHLHERMISYVPLRERLRFLRLYAGNDHNVYRNELRRMIRKSKRAAPHDKTDKIPTKTP